MLTFEKPDQVKDLLHQPAVRITFIARLTTCSFISRIALFWLSGDPLIQRPFHSHTFKVAPVFCSILSKFSRLFPMTWPMYSLGMKSSFFQDSWSGLSSPCVSDKRTLTNKPQHMKKYVKTLKEWRNKRRKASRQPASQLATHKAGIRAHKPTTIMSGVRFHKRLVTRF